MASMTSVDFITFSARVAQLKNYADQFAQLKTQFDNAQAGESWTVVPELSAFHPASQASTAWLGLNFGGMAAIFQNAIQNMLKAVATIQFSDEINRQQITAVNGLLEAARDAITGVSAAVAPGPAIDPAEFVPAGAPETED